MSLSIKNINRADSKQWDQVWRNCDYATFFHSREWAEIWDRYTNGKIAPDPKLIEFSDGTKAILPLSRRKKYMGLSKSYTSSPAGTFGGWISADPLAIYHAKLLAHYMTHLGKLFWRLNPYDQLALNCDIKVNREDETHALNLLKGYEQIFNEMRKGHKSAAKKATRDGVVIRLGLTLDDWKAYYQIYQDSLRRWGDKATSNYSWKFFNEMFQRESPNIKLWLAIYKKKIIAGAICFQAPKHVAYWHGAALEEYFNLRPANLLVCNMIKYSCEQGVSWFDFNPSGSHEGVKAFKRNFGAKPYPSPIVILQTSFSNPFR